MPMLGLMVRRWRVSWWLVLQCLVQFLFLAQFLLRQPLQSAATQEFHITGGWADPQVEKIQRQPPNPAASTAPALQ